MSAQHKSADDEIMRRSFDAAYRGIGWMASVHWRELPSRARHAWLDMHSNVRRILKIELALLLLTVLLSFAALAALRAWEAANQPTLVERMQVALPMDMRPAPSEALAWPQSINAWALTDNELKPATSLARCLLSIASETPECGLLATATWGESRVYANAEGLMVRVTALSLGEAAKPALEEAYHLARRLGRVGSFALMDSLTVTYLTTSIDDEWQFTWTHEGWLYSVAGADYAALTAFVESFPY